MLSPQNTLKMLENYARSAQLLAARGEHEPAQRVEAAIVSTLETFEQQYPEYYAEAHDAIDRGRRQAEGEAAVRILRNNGIVVSAEDMRRAYGPPPYSRPEDVPPMQRALAEIFVSAVKRDPDDPKPKKALQDLRDQGVLPQGSLTAWNIEVPPALDSHAVEGKPVKKPRANSSVQRRRTHAASANARPNHHLTGVAERMAFVLHWRKLFKGAGDNRGLSLLNKHLEALTSIKSVKDVNDAKRVEQMIAAAYAALEAYLRSTSQWSSHPDLEWRPADAISPRQNGLMLAQLKRAASSAGGAVKKAARAPSTDQAISGTAQAAVKGAKAAGRAAAKGVAVVGRGLTDMLTKLRQNGDVPQDVQSAAKEYGTAQGYPVVDVAAVAGKRNVYDVYCRRHAGDNFGICVRMSKPKRASTWTFSVNRAK